jgi:hypothetical protein
MGAAECGSIRGLAGAVAIERRDPHQGAGYLLLAGIVEAIANRRQPAWRFPGRRLPEFVQTTTPGKPFSRACSLRQHEVAGMKCRRVDPRQQQRTAAPQIDHRPAEIAACTAADEPNSELPNAIPSCSGSNPVIVRVPAAKLSNTNSSGAAGVSPAAPH